MRKALRKFFSVIGYISFFCGYFYILFVNLVCGFSSNGIETRWDAFKILLVAFIISAGLPGIICYQHHKIFKLEEQLEDIYNI